MLQENEMKQITGERCIELMKEKFPGFLSYWEAYIRDFGADNGLHIQMLPFDEYTIDTIKSNDEAEMEKILGLWNFCSAMVMMMCKQLLRRPIQSI